MSNFLKEVNGVPRGTAIAPGDLPTITLTSDVTGSGSGGSVATTVSKIQGTSVSGTTGSGNVVFATSPAFSAATITGFTTITDAGTIVNSTNSTKVLGFTLNGMATNTTLLLGFPQTTTQTLTFPNIASSDTLATLGLTQTFTGANTFNGSGTALTVTNTAAIGTLSLTNELTIPNGGTGGTSQATALSALGIRSGSHSISSATTSQTVTYSSTLGTTSYSLTCTLLNITDSNPQLQPITVTSFSATGFTATWNAPTLTGNYVLHYQAIINV